MNTKPTGLETAAAWLGWATVALVLAVLWFT
jgi:hypothetical protein